MVASLVIEKGTPPPHYTTMRECIYFRECINTMGLTETRTIIIHTLFPIPYLGDKHREKQDQKREL